MLNLQIYNPMLRQYWWKLLSAVILVFVLIFGLKTPLKPGIVGSFPLSGTVGETLTLNVEGYNTHFAAAKSQTAYLKNGEQKVIAASAIVTKDEQTAALTFSLPSTPIAARESLTLIVNNEIDGNIILPSALLLKESKSPVPSSNQAWSPLNITDLHKVDGYRFPYRNILHETIRNTFFHVAIWFAMFILFVVGLVNSILYLIKKRLIYDRIAAAFTEVGILYGMVGLATGSMWAKYTWGAWWTDDIKLNMSAIAILIYLAYLILRRSVHDVDSKARLAAAYNIFSFLILIPLIFIIPRMTDSLHPGNGGNPALGGEDLDNTLRLIFYPAIIGLTLLGVWLSSLSYRLSLLKDRWILNQD